MRSKACFLTKSPGDVVLRAFIFRIGKDDLRTVVFDQFTHIKESGMVTYPSGLLHVMRYDDNGKLVLQFIDQFFDLCC